MISWRRVFGPMFPLHFVILFLLSFDSAPVLLPVLPISFVVCFGRDWSIRFCSLCYVYLHSLRMRSFYACARVVCFYVTLVCAKTMRIVTKFVSRNTWGVSLIRRRTNTTTTNGTRRQVSLMETSTKRSDSTFVKTI